MPEYEFIYNGLVDTFVANSDGIKCVVCSPALHTYIQTDIHRVEAYVFSKTPILNALGVVLTLSSLGLDDATVNFLYSK